MIISNTFTAQIFVGFKCMDTGKESTLQDAEKICQDYVNDIGLCVSTVPTRFIYTKGNENGVCVTLINYPRYPESSYEIKERALVLAEKLKTNLDQNRVSVVFPSETLMLS